MKFSINVKAFADAATAIGKVVERRTTYPILANVLLKAEGDGITLRGTDLDLELTVAVAARVEADGVTTLPAATLGDILRKLPKEAEIAVESGEDGTIALGSGRSKFRLTTLSPESFPELTGASETPTRFEIKGKALASALETVRFAISTEETRYYLKGVYVHPVDGGLAFVATDGHRLAWCRRDVEGVGGLAPIIVPRKTVGELIRIGEAAGNVTIEATPTRVRVEAGTTVLVSKLIEGTFPDYERVTPKANNIVVEAAADALLAALDRVSTMASDRGGKAVRLGFSPGTARLDVENPDNGNATEDVAVDADIDAFEIGFNARYLAEILSGFGSDKVRIELKDPGNPTLLRPVDGNDVRFVLMPMRV